MKFHTNCRGFVFCFGSQFAVRLMSSHQNFRFQKSSWTRITIGYSGLALEKLRHSFILLLGDALQVQRLLDPLFLLHADSLGKDFFASGFFIC